MKLFVVILLTFLFNCCVAQQSEEAAIKQCINQFFNGMKNNDTTIIRTSLDSSTFLYSIAETETGNVILQNEKMTDFLQQVSKLKGQQLDERLLSFDIKIDGAMAIAWTPYQFFFNGKLSHCGVNVFTLIRRAAGWKIMGITDTRRKLRCT